MEKKTIGGFIAALRKVNGMTQKELAERLNVSDKTVSRWERDDGAPDLSAIPVIAEVFGVTCDELLRGERKSPTERAEMTEEAETSPKAEKQRQRLLKSALSQYQNQTLIAMGVAVVGVIAALICNLAFQQAVLGFLIGAIFFTAGIICQDVFLNKAFLKVEDAGVEEEQLSHYRKKVIVIAEKSIGLTVLLIGFTFPLIMVNAYFGLELNSMLLFGTVSAVIFLMIYAVALYFVNGLLLKKGVYRLSGEAFETYSHNRTLKKKCAVGYAIVLAVTLVIHLLGNAMIWNTEQLSMHYGITFDDYESFVTFMEQDVPCDPDYIYEWNVFSAEVKDSANVSFEEQAEWYDEDGNLISEEEFPITTLKDENGNVVCTYTHKNRSVSSISYTSKDGTVLPIKVVTTSGYRVAEGLSDGINTAYCFLYPLELLAVLLIYFKKRAK